MTQAYNLGQFGNKVNTSGQADLTTAVTGTLPVNNGGTGQTTYTNGQLLIGNTTGNTLTKTTLTAGTGISITNGAGAITIASTASGGFNNITTLTTTGPQPWTAPPSTTLVRVTVIGGGGGGGNLSSSGLPPGAVGGGGGGGGGAGIGIFPVTGGTPYTVTVGAGGVPASAPTSPGIATAGGTSSFSTLLTCTGGSGGGSTSGSSTAGAGGAGGTSTGGQINITGQSGADGLSATNIPFGASWASGAGGSTFMGFGAAMGGQFAGGFGGGASSGTLNPAPAPTTSKNNGVVIIEY